MARIRDRKRLQHAASLDWPLVAKMQLLGYELIRAKEEQPDVDPAIRANGIIFEVLAEIGEETFTQALIDADFRMKTSTKALVTTEALSTSGYDAVRQRIIVNLNFDDLKQAEYQRSWNDVRELAATASSENDRETLSRLAVSFLTNLAGEAKPNPIEKRWDVIVGRYDGSSWSTRRRMDRRCRHLSKRDYF